ncbi:MAG: DUF4428 domain-containing protein [Erysipelotrichaceae bacterium]|nr:DUF4428 domain-containing protein [Erysipelotrichaceae bacterium]
MGLFDKMFKKKVCAICGNEIGLLGNKKLEDGNLCKKCAAKLSPFFSERRNSTVQEISEQLQYREENKKALENFNTTLTYGDYQKIHFDEDQNAFVVTSATNIVEANPDIIHLSQVTGCELHISENANEEQYDDKEGNSVSYDPPRYIYSYDFDITLHVNHPYFNEITIRLNSSDIETTTTAVEARRKPQPRWNDKYCKYEKMGNEIVQKLLQSRIEREVNAQPRKAVTCPYCGATTTPDKKGCCEYCGSSLQ